MNFPDDQMEEFKRTFPTAKLAVEGGTTFFLLPQWQLPENCAPRTVDLLFCPTARDGYNSRLFFAQSMSLPKTRNWISKNVQILGRSWFAYSWKVEEGLTITERLTAHLYSITK